jgi:succinate-acetate transporter protein
LPTTLTGGTTRPLPPDGKWAYLSRDEVATDIFAPFGVASVEFAWWLIPLAAVTWMIAVGAMGRSAAIGITLLILAAGTTIAAVAYCNGFPTISQVAGYFWVVAAVGAWFTASARMMRAAFGRNVLVPGRSPRCLREVQDIEPMEEPGVTTRQYL